MNETTWPLSAGQQDGLPAECFAGIFSWECFRGILKTLSLLVLNTYKFKRIRYRCFIFLHKMKQLCRILRTPYVGNSGEPGGEEKLDIFHYPGKCLLFHGCQCNLALISGHCFSDHLKPFICAGAETFLPCQQSHQEIAEIKNPDIFLA